jgi:hypothetical protein
MSTCACAAVACAHNHACAGSLTSFAAGAAERNPDHCGAGGVPYPGRLVTASSTGPVTGADLADEAKQATTPHQITYIGATILVL